MDVNRAILGAVIALLRVRTGAIDTHGLIRHGLKIAREIDIQEDIGNKGEGRKGFVTRQKNVAVAGTAEQLPDVAVRLGTKLTMIAKPRNGGIIFFGHSKTEAEGNNTFDGLDAGLAHSFDVLNAKEIWIDASKSGNGVSIYVEQ